jgi:hypothetical protein
MKYPTAFAVIAAAAAVAGIAAPRPVTIAAASVGETCPNDGEVQGLTARDNFLSVRAGPGVRERERDRLHNGTVVMICDRAANGAWLGVIYGPGHNQDCLIRQTDMRRLPYHGPCRSGWVSARYIRVTRR